VGKIYYGNFAWAHDVALVVKPKLDLNWAHKNVSYMDGFVTPEMWAAWNEFKQDEGAIRVVRPCSDGEREEAVKNAEKQFLK
jgi:hypothetical protein